MSSTPPAKRSRTDTTDDNNINTTAAARNNNDTNNNSSIEDNNNDVISTSKILQQITTLSNDYCNATPFPHGVINNFCTDGLLGELYIYSNSKAMLCIVHHFLQSLTIIPFTIHIHALFPYTRYISHIITQRRY